MRRGFKFQGGLLSTDGRHHQPNFKYFKEGEFYFWRLALFVGPFNRNGDQNGPYANVFMRKLERDLLSYTSNIPSSWWRYIDDVFAIWPHSESNLEIFLNDLNSFHPTIKFSAEWSKESVMFLDTRVINKEDISLQIFIQNLQTPINISTPIAVAHPTIKKDCL